MAEKSVELDSIELAAAIFGNCDQNVKLLENEFHVTAVCRGSLLKFTGEPKDVEAAVHAVDGMVTLMQNHTPLEEQTVRYCISLARGGEEKRLRELNDDFVAVTAKGRPIHPKTLGQKEYLSAIRANSITFNIVMAVFDVSQQVIQQSAGLIRGSTAVTPDVLNDMQTQLEAMELGPLLGIFLQSFFVQFTMTALNIVIFVIVYGRMIEIYLMTSLAPIPFATSANREAGHMGHNYFKSLFAIGFQGMLIMVCMAIYAVLVQSIATSGDMMAAIWECVGYTVLLVFVLFKTGSLSKSIFGAH